MFISDIFHSKVFALKKSRDFCIRKIFSYKEGLAVAPRADILEKGPHSTINFYKVNFSLENLNFDFGDLLVPKFSIYRPGECADFQIWKNRFFVFTHNPYSVWTFLDGVWVEFSQLENVARFYSLDSLINNRYWIFSVFYEDQNFNGDALFIFDFGNFSNRLVPAPYYRRDAKKVYFKISEDKFGLAFVKKDYFRIYFFEFSSFLFSPIFVDCSLSPPVASNQIVNATTPPIYDPWFRHISFSFRAPNHLSFSFFHSSNSFLERRIFSFERMKLK